MIQISCMISSWCSIFLTHISIQYLRLICTRWRMRLHYITHQLYKPSHDRSMPTDESWHTNVDQLMSMIRNTSLTNQIHLNWQTQDLHLINPAWFIKEYLMPTSPTEINEWTTISLQKWEYLWIIFDIPWAEVNINWEWIPYNKDNQSLIKSQNPFNLKWRLNWKLAKKMWYNKNNPIKWKLQLIKYF